MSRHVGKAQPAIAVVLKGFPLGSSLKVGDVIIRGHHGMWRLRGDGTDNHWWIPEDSSTIKLSHRMTELEKAVYGI